MKKPQNKYIYLLFIIGGFLLYGNTLSHEFALDDAIVINDNSFTKKGFAGIWDQLTNDQFMGFYGEKKSLVSGGRYRPLSMVLFNIEYALFGENASIGHLMNVLWYILNGILLYLSLKLLLPEKYAQSIWVGLPLLASLLWFFHPIHTEVVANIKGRDEIMAFSGELITLLLILKYLQHKKPLYLLGIGFSYFLTLLSKENAITWLAVYPLAIYFFKKNDFKASLPAFGVLLFSAIAWLYIRYLVVGEGISNVADNLMNDPFLEASNSEKYATIVFTLGKYLQLLVFPHPLTFDYYPKHIPILNWSSNVVIFSVLAYLLLIFIAIKGFFNRNLISFSILFFGITLSIASNVLFPIGVFMNERFVFVSSLGFSLVLAYFILFVLPNWFRNKKNALTILKFSSFIILALYSAKTISRNVVWKNNFTLATNDALISINGAKSNVMAGGQLTEKAQVTQNSAEKKQLLAKAIMHLNRAINNYPEYIDALLLMGNAQWEYTKDAKNALPFYQRIIAINPNNNNAWTNSLIVLEQSKDVNYKINSYETLLRYNPNRAEVYINLGRSYGRDKGNLTKAVEVFETGRKIAPNNFDLLSNLGTVYGLQQNYPKAIEVLEAAIKIQPNNAKSHIDLGLSYFYNQNPSKAKFHFDTAFKLDPSIDRNQLPL